MKKKKKHFFKQQLLDVIALAVNVMLILESEETIFLDLIALAVNVMLILESKETIFFGCNRTSCKRYLDFRK